MRIPAQRSCWAQLPTTALPGDTSAAALPAASHSCCFCPSPAPLLPGSSLSISPVAALFEQKDGSCISVLPPPQTQVPRAAPASSLVLLPALLSVGQRVSFSTAMCLSVMLLWCPEPGELLLKWLPCPRHLGRCVTGFLVVTVYQVPYLQLLPVPWRLCTTYK